MGGNVGPRLIENKIAKGIKNRFVFINFVILPNVGVMTMNNVSASINQLSGQYLAPFFRIG